MDDQNNPNDTEVLEVTTVETEEIETTNPAGDAIVVTNLQDLINETLVKIDMMGEEVKPLDEMVASVLENDQTFQQHAYEAKEAAKKKTATKSEIMKRPDVKQIAEKIKDKKADIKEAKESLSEYLQEYARLTGRQQFETKDGVVQEIVYTAKLMKRS